MPTDFLEKLLAREKAKAMAVGFAEGFAETIVDGFVEKVQYGMKLAGDRRAKSIARNMLVAGFPTKTIIDLTGVDPDTLEEIEKSLNDD